MCEDREEREVSERVSEGVDEEEREMIGLEYEREKLSVA